MNMYDIFTDAHRRVCIARQRNEFDRSRIWVGLAMPSDIKKAVKEGLMVANGTETAKTLNWYRFTDKGWKAYDQVFKDAPDYFDPAFETFYVNVSRRNTKSVDAEPAVLAQPR